MSLTNCPMCQASLPAEGNVNSCGDCGADLSRWLPKPRKATVDVEASVVSTEAPAAEASGLQRGILGVAAGAVGGLVVMYGFHLATGLRFWWLGCGTGLLTGFAARKFNQGGDEKLGIMAAVAATLSVLGSLYLIYGSELTGTEILVLNCISLAVSARVAYRIASR